MERIQQLAYSQQTDLSKWLEFYVQHSVRLDVIRQTKLNTGRVVRYTLTMHLFTELIRLFMFSLLPGHLADPTIEETQTLSNMEHPLWVQISETFDITKQYEEKEDKDVDVEETCSVIKTLWTRPVAQYTLRESMLILFFLIQQLDVVPQSCVVEYRSMFRSLQFRLGMLMQKQLPAHVLDDPDYCNNGCINRTFLAVISVYVSTICGRFLFYDRLVSRNTIQAPSYLGERVREWLHKILTDLPDESFEDQYIATCENGYNFPGDEAVFRYRWPQKVMSRSACLAQLHPHLYRQYHSESRMTKMRVLDVANQSHSARLFVFSLVSSATYDRWESTIVIDSNDMANESKRILDNETPFIIQSLSSYWAYDRGEVYRTDDIFESIGVWFYLLKTRYNSQLINMDWHIFVADAIDADNNRINLEGSFFL